MMINKNIDFMKLCRYIFPVSIVTMLISFSLIFLMKMNLGIDFTSGTRFDMAISKSDGEIISIDEIKKIINQTALEDNYTIKALEGEQTRNTQIFSIISQDTFNGVSLFAIKATGGGADGVFGGGAGLDNTVSIYTTERGSSGPIVSLNKALLLSAITFNSSDVSTNLAYGTAGAKTLAATSSASGVNLSAVEVSFFTQAIENIATLRAENGGTVSRFNFAYEQANRTKATLEAANGRIMDVDIATESTRLAKYNILVQASASMLAQANTTPNAALMLLG